jgi:drug/metabolite transporter (DMT)-like permease
VRGEIKPLFAMEQGTLRSIAAGIALTVVVSSPFCAVAWVGQRGGADLGHVHCRRRPARRLFLGEPMTWSKIVGLTAAVLGVVLISI